MIDTAAGSSDGTATSARRALSEGRIAEANAILRRCCRERADRLSDVAELSELAAEMDKLAQRGAPDVNRCRTAILGDYNSLPFVMAMRCALLADGVVARVYEGQFGAWRQEILDDSSALYLFAPELVLLAAGAPSIIGLPNGPASEADIERALDSELAGWQRCWALLRQRLGCPVIQHLFATPEQNFIGPAERLLPWAPASFVEALNRRLMREAPSFVRWLDVDRLSARIGRRNWNDARMYYHARQGLDMRYLPEYIRTLRGGWRSASGRTAKVLVTDLDNTLWGGEIGDDGIEGIKLGEGSGEGEAFAAFCLYLKALAQRGVVLAVCSKNDPGIARQVFRSHPGMPLRIEEFAAFVCNWNDKVSNLRAIARQLNLDLSSFVFVDDNQAECELIRQRLREVTVVELSGDPSQFVRRLDEQHLFDTPFLSSEDFARSASYAARTQALQLQERTTDLEGYLKSLEMRGMSFVAGAEHLNRLAQMERKTNQFNLTGRRYSAEALGRLMTDPGALVFAFRLADRLADHGIVGSLIAVLEGTTVRIDSWLLSCRVFSRTAEHFMLARVIERARAEGARALIGEYAASAKNSVVADLYPRLGFSPVRGDGRWWRLPLEADCMKRLGTYVSQEVAD